MDELYHEFNNRCSGGDIEQVKSIINDNQLQSITLSSGFYNAALNNNIDIMKYIFNYSQINNMKIHIGISDINLCCKLINIITNTSIEIIKYIIYLYRHTYNYYISICTDDLSASDTATIFINWLIRMAIDLRDNIEFNEITRKTHIIYRHKNITSDVSFSICNHTTNIYILNNNSVCSSCINKVICNTYYIFTINRDDVYDE